MISHLSIKDFALIETLSADFHHGLNIVTGETGAGKSIIIEAINLALGSRADTTYVRTGKDKAIIQLIIDIDHPTIIPVLKENGIPIENQQLIITREIYTSGKSICKMNDTLITVSLLNKISRKLVDIHGQYDHQSLLNTENHIHLIDMFYREQISQIKTQVQQSFNSYIHLSRELDHLVKSKNESERKKDFLKYEWTEISNASLAIGEDDTLNQTLDILQNSEKIFNALTSAYDIIYAESDAVINKLGKASIVMKEIQMYDSKLSAFENNITDCLYQLEDMSREIRMYRDQTQFSPDEIDQIQERLELINNLKRKYGSSIEKIIEYKDKIEKEIYAMENSDEVIKQLKEQINAVESNLNQHCLELTECRKNAAGEIEQKIKNELNDLYFNNSDFKVQFETAVGNQGQTLYSPNGIDIIEFLISTNKGEPLKPLSKIASGGEISRIMLAFKRIIGDFDEIPTMIFDEIDSGISGQTASIVGKKLAQISRKHQIICITHLPQISAMGDYHYRIEKQSNQNGTTTHINELDSSETIKEISRLLGGENISAAAIKNAEDMLNQAKTIKKKE